MKTKLAGVIGFMALLAPAAAMAGPSMPRSPLAVSSQADTVAVGGDRPSQVLGTQVGSSDALLRDGDAATPEKAYYYRYYRYHYYRPYRYYRPYGFYRPYRSYRYRYFY